MKDMTCDKLSMGNKTDGICNPTVISVPDSNTYIGVMKK